MLPLSPPKKKRPYVHLLEGMKGDDSTATAKTEGSDSDSDSILNKLEMEAQVESEKDMLVVKKLARSETRAATISRRILVSFMMLAGFVVSASVFMGVRERDVDDSVQTYNILVETLAEYWRENMDSIAQGFEYMAEEVALEAAVNSDEDIFPFVTVNQFEVTGRIAREVSGIQQFIYAPHMHAITNDVWSKYASSSADQWITASRAVAAIEETNTDQKFNDEITPYIFEWHDQHTKKIKSTKGPLAPIWQISPVPNDVSGLINQDVLGDYVVRRLSEAIFTNQAKQGLISSVEYHNEDIFGPKVFNEVPSGRDVPSGTPLSIFAKPVVQHPGGQYVGLILGEIDWDEIFFSKELPAGNSGIYVVLRNTCGQAFTYLIDEENYGDFLGVGDLHDVTFDDTEVVTWLSSIGKGLEDVDGHCVYSLSMYSSNEFRSKFKKSLWFGPAIAVAFLLVNIAFVCYDRSVQRRADKVVRTAARFNAILSELYSSNLRRIVATQKPKPPSRQEWRLNILEDDSCSAIDENGQEEELVEHPVV